MLPLSTPFSSCHAKAGKPKYKLVWKDNFKGNTYDNNSWSKISRGKPDWCKKMSDDDRLYDVKDGLLILRGCVNDGSYQYEGKTDTARYVTGASSVMEKWKCALAWVVPKVPGQPSGCCRRRAVGPTTAR